MTVILALGATASPQTGVQFVTLKPDALNQVPTHHRARIADRLELYVRSTNAVDLDQIYALMPRSCTEGLERNNWRKQVHVDSRGLLRAFYVDEVYPGEYTFPAKVDGEKWIATGCGTYQRGDKSVKFKASIKLVLAVMNGTSAAVVLPSKANTTNRCLATAHNNSLDRSGGGVFRIKLGAAKVEWNRAAASTLTLCGFTLLNTDTHD